MARQKENKTAEPTEVTVAFTLSLLVSVSAIAIAVCLSPAHAQTISSSGVDWTSTNSTNGGSTYTKRSQLYNGQVIGTDTSGHTTILQGSGVTSSYGATSASFDAGGVSVSNGTNVTTIGPSSVTTGTVYADAFSGGSLSTDSVSTSSLSVSNGSNATTITPTSVTTGTLHATTLDVDNFSATNLSITNMNATGAISATSLTTTGAVNSGSVNTGTVNATTVNASTFNGGAFNGQSLTVTDGTNTSTILPGSISTTGTLSSASLSTGAISTTGVTSSGNISTTGALSSGSLSTGAISTTGITSSGNISTTGALSSGSLSTGAIDATNITTDTITANTLNTTNFNAANLGASNLTVSDGTNTTTVTPTSVKTWSVTADHIYIPHAGGTNYIDLNASADKATFQGMTLEVTTADGSSSTRIVDGAITASDSVTTKDLTATGTTTVTTLKVASGGTADMGGAVVHNVATPLVDTDAANKAYVDSVWYDNGTRMRELNDKMDAGLRNANRRIDETQEGVAIALALQQPIFAPGQSFAFRAGWGNFEGESAFGLSGAGIIGRDWFGQGTVVALDGGFGFGASSGVMAGKAGVTFGW
ncbi:hypothetical protein KKP04_01930 [Rhodomicrobium sp. Az07]|uniref:beta strand repeat-containing protein n=1 Tax=Rhodomicrobium sp. Az07 TaxID=2839034 RepID=UPI001BEA3F9D|nr:hypothetical protein [Rhodomicrobium sp. Az07]MBT3069630.1 hypothetical protein [Rhodomicrobium sp. Az07]